MSYFVDAEDEKKYVEYIRKGQQEHATLRAKIMEILGYHYEGLYLFFWERLSDPKYDYLILMSRRCFVLCQLYILFFMLDGKVPENKMKILSDRALIRYKEKLVSGNCAVQIVDDILIHGRTIRDMCGMFCNSSVLVDSYVYMRCVDMECVGEEVRTKLYCSLEGDAGQWRELSDKLVQAIHTANVPYTSYVLAYSYFDCKKNFEEFERQTENEVIENTSLFQKKCGVRTVSVFNDVCKDIPIFKSLALEQCVRIYYKEDSRRTLVIPYVFIKEIERNRFIKILTDISCVIQADCPTLSDVLANKADESSQMLEFKMRLLTCIISNIYWERCKETYGFNGDQSEFIDVDTIEKSFGSDIANEILYMQTNCISKICECSFEDAQMSECVEDEDEVKLISNLKHQEVNNDHNLLFFYFQQAWRCDEERAKLQKSRLPGLRVDTILKHIDKEARTVLASLINAWDTGIATANCLFSQDGNVIGCYNAPGEQGYKIILCRNPHLFSILIYVSKYFQGLYLDEQEYMATRLKIMKQIIDMFEEKYGKKMDDVREIVQEENGDIQTWNSADTIDAYITKSTYEEDKLILKTVLGQNRW